MLKIIFIILAAPLVLGSLCTLILGRKIKGPLPPALLFHSIRDSGLSTMSQFSSDRFQELLEKLHALKITLQTVKEAVVPGNVDRTVCLTFDDGCSDFYTHALPRLELFNFKVTLFPVSGFLGRSSTWDVMPAFDHLTGREIREISDLGHEIGSHGATHANLTLLSDNQLKEELLSSKKHLEDITGKAVCSISFPFGFWNKRVWSMCRQCGYTSGTIYRSHARRQSGLLPVVGVYRFDTVEDILSKIMPGIPYSPALALSRLMCHFSKGAPIWKFRKEYRIR